MINLNLYILSKTFKKIFFLLRQAKISDRKGGYMN